MKKMLLNFLAAAGGFGLSFVGLGLLWIGTPWALQALMFLPFFVLSYVIDRALKDPDNLGFVPIILGALPLGGFIPMFRTPDGSHLPAIGIIASWAAGVFAGRYIARRKTVTH